MKSLKSRIGTRSFWAFLLAAVTAAFFIITDFGASQERQLRSLRDIVREKPASGSIIVAEIDAKSIAALSEWPWPRSYHARLVDKLQKAEVSQIAFDVDFSATSTLVQDEAFAAALERAGGSVILPTFRQKQSENSELFVESLPLEMLRENAFLASVNVHPDKAGQLNRLSFGTETGGITRPALASMLAGTTGQRGHSFDIDQSINPATIPKYSFVDILSDKIPAEKLAGKKILIGATAIELGDRYPTSNHGVLPGVIIQAMAAETLIQDAVLPNYGPLVPLVLVTMVIMMWMRPEVPMRQRRTSAMMAATTAVFITAMISEYAALGSFAIIPALSFLAAFFLTDKLLGLASEISKALLLDTRSTLPNEKALQEYVSQNPDVHIATALIENYSEAEAILDADGQKNMFATIADRLKFLARQEDIYHLESDIFAWVIREDYEDNLSGLFDTAAALFRSAVNTDTHQIRLNMHFGISNGHIGKAKLAASYALETGARWRWHNDEFIQQISEKQELLVDIDTALENREIWVAYQPKWHMRENRLFGAEALVRWNHPEKGPIRPDTFIPVLEKNDRIADLTLYVLHAILDDLQKWNACGDALGVAINISAKLLYDDIFVQNALQQIAASPVDAEQITFEITESAALGNAQLAAKVLNQIAATGIKISIDDYGTGQSTLSYLQQFPAKEIKIDQSFVKSISDNDADRVMVRSTIELAHALGFSVVAEGIEDQACMDILNDYECDVGQGWHIGKPVRSVEFEQEWVGESKLKASFVIQNEIEISDVLRNSA